MKVISNKEYEIIKLKQDNNKLYMQELEKRIVEISGANKCYKLENRRLRKKIDKAIEHLHKSYEQNNSALTNKEETIISIHELLKLENINNKILEDILRGE